MTDLEFNKLYQENKKYFANFSLLKKIKSREDQEDLLQEFWTIIAKKTTTKLLTPEGELNKTLLLGIFANRIKNYFNNIKATVKLDDNFLASPEELLYFSTEKLNKREKGFLKLFQTLQNNNEEEITIQQEMLEILGIGVRQYLRYLKSIKKKLREEGNGA